MTNRHRSIARRLRSIFLWHRYLGLAISLLVMLLAITGVLLNHTERLNLDSRHVQADWLLHWYGVAPAEPPVSFKVNDDWLSSLEGRLYLNAQPVAEGFGRLLGAVGTSGVFVAASTDALVLLTPRGELIERMGVASLPGEVERIGLSPQQRVLLETIDGIYTADSALLGWRPARSGHGAWATAQTAPANINDRILQAYRGVGLPWERVLLDLHSGRILGGWGVYLMDAAAIGLILLTLTGVYNWWQRRRAQLKHRRPKTPH